MPPIMHHGRNSPVHSRRQLLCGDLRVRTQSVNRSSMGYPPCPQSLTSLEYISPLTTSSFVAPMLAPDRNSRMFHPMDLVAPGYCLDPLVIYAPNPPHFTGYYPVAHNGLASDAYDPCVPTYQHVDNSLDFGGIYSEPIGLQPPPTPPAAPDHSPPSSPTFSYHQCRWLSGPPCDGAAPGRNREMGEHLRVAHRFVGHERDPVQCLWEDCGQIMQRMNVPRHIVSRHLLAAANCRFCGKRFSRPDVVARHERTCGISPVSSSPATRV